MPQEDPAGGPVFPRGRRKGGEPQANSDLGAPKEQRPHPRHRPPQIRGSPGSRGRRPSKRTVPFSPTLALDVRVAGTDAGDRVEDEERRWGRAPDDSGGPWASALPSAAASSHWLASLRSWLPQVTCGRARRARRLQGPPPRPARGSEAWAAAPRSGRRGTVGAGGGGAQRPWGCPWSAVSSQLGPLSLPPWPRGLLRRVGGGEGAAQGRGFPGAGVAKRSVGGRGNKPSLNRWPSGYFKIPVVHLTRIAQWR